MISSLARAQPSLSTDLYQVSLISCLQAPIHVQRELLFNIAILILQSSALRAISVLILQCASSMGMHCMYIIPDFPSYPVFPSAYTYIYQSFPASSFSDFSPFISSLPLPPSFRPQISPEVRREVWDHGRSSRRQSLHLGCGAERL